VISGKPREFHSITSRNGAPGENPVISESRCFVARENDRINFVVVAPKGDQDSGADHFRNWVSLAWTQNYPVTCGGLSESFSGF